MVANEETVVVELFNPNEIVQELTEYICTLLEENEAEQFRNTCGTLAGQGNLLELINVFYEQLAKHLNEESSIRFAIVFSLMRRLDPETLGMVVVSLHSNHLHLRRRFPFSSANLEKCKYEQV